MRLEAVDLHGSYDGLRTLFRIKELVLRRGQKMAVVGSNGCGKSTLLGALSGRQELAEGSVRFEPNMRVAMVEQNPEYDPEMTVLQAVYEGAESPQAVAARRYRAACVKSEPEELEAAMEGMESAGAWDWETRAARMLQELGLDSLQGRRMGELSGGEERRVALACALVDIDRTDLLILDEPTNHLSTEGCDWLQEMLQGLAGVGVLLVTHDRYFLDKVCDGILEIDGLGATFSHPGGWDVFLQRRAERYALRASSVNDAKVQLKRAQEWKDRGPRGRGTKNKAQMTDYYKTKEKAEAVIAANDGAPALGNAWLSGSEMSAKGERTQGSSTNLGLIGLKNITVLRENGEPILDQVSFQFPRGTKLGIVGPNGAGKSTLLRVLAGVQAPDVGQLLEGDNVRLGYLTQEAPSWPDPHQKVLAAVAEMADEVLLEGNSILPNSADMSREQATAGLLKSVNFAQERWNTEVGMLSGGEERRLQLLRVLSRQPNVLLLDEPTNDLDAVTVDALERLLQPWPGSVIVISHDRSLLDGVCDELIVFPKDGGRPSTWLGSYTEFRARERQAADIPAESKAEVAGAATPAPAKRMDRKVSKELRKLEQKIERVEGELAKVQAEMESSGDDAEKVMELHEKSQKLEERQMELYEQWEALAAEAEG